MVTRAIFRGKVPDFFSSGSGYGSWDGYGYGYGYGDGYGYGYGSGSGYGYGSEKYWKAAIAAYASRWPPTQRARLAELEAAGATIAYWKSGAHGKPCNGGSGKPVAIGMIQEEKGPLTLCQKGTLHGTLMPQKWHGDRTWIVALIGDTVSDGDKIGALKREIIGEI